MKKNKVIFIIFVVFCITISLYAKNIDDTKSETITVYVTKSGTCYHRRSCSSLSRSKNIKPLTKEAAKSKGYKSCSKCKP